MVQLPRFVLVEQQLPNRAVPDIPSRIREQLAGSGIPSRIRPGARVAIGVGSRGISNIATIVRSVIDFWKEHGAQPFLFPAMGSHGAATAEGQADVLAHYGIHEATMGVPVVSSLEVEPLGQTPEGISTYLDKNAFDADAIFLIGRVKWHTDFSGPLESGLVKMMAIGLGKFAGARQYHTFAYKLGLERVIRSAGAKVFACAKILGGLAIQEGAHHETAGLVVIDGGQGFEKIVAEEEKLLSEVKSWMAKLPASEIDILILDEIGKNISGAGMDTKVVNRSINGQYNPFPDTPRVERIYLRALSEHTYHSAVGVGLADAVRETLLKDVDWTPTYINSLTASTPAAIRSPIHFPTDLEALSKLAPTVGRLDLGEVTFCRIRNTLELVHTAVSENLLPKLAGNVRVVSEPFEAPLDADGNLREFSGLDRTRDELEDFEEASQESVAGREIVRG